MKASLLNRLIKLEQEKAIEAVKPYIFFHDGDPEPADTENYNILRIRIVDHSNYKVFL